MTVVQRAASSGGPPRLTRRQTVLTMAGVMLGIFLASLDQTIVGTALPRIVADLGGFDRFTWITSAYIVASTTVVPIVGRLSDLYGRKAFYVAAAVVFLVGSALAGLSQTMDQLIAFRAIQGIGGGALMSLAFVAVGDLFPPADRGKYQGFVAGVFGMSSVIGPTLGGFITDTLSWNWIFYINMPLGLPILFLLVKFFPNVRPAAVSRQIDFAGMAALVVAIVSLLLALSWADVQYEWLSIQIVGLLTLAAVSAAALILIEMRAADPIMPLTIYRNRVVSLAMFAIACTGFGMFGTIVFIPLYFQGVLGTSATSSGSFLTPMMLGIVVGAAISGQALSRLGGHYRLQGLIGIAAMGAGTFLVSTMSTTTSFGTAVSYIVVLGFGLGITFPSFTIAVQNAVPHSLLGAATSATQFYRSVGGAMGLAVLGSLMASRFTSGLSESLSPGIREALPAERLAGLGNDPQAVVNPDALGALQSAVGDAALAQELLAALRGALADAIGDTFLVGVGILALAAAATAFMKEYPLSKGWEGGGPTA